MILVFEISFSGAIDPSELACPGLGKEDTGNQRVRRETRRDSVRGADALVVPWIPCTCTKL